MPRHLRTSLLPLAVLYAALVVYASLYPFTGWRDPGSPPWNFVTLPWPRWWTGFDLISNLLGYVPFGALLCGALLRIGHRRALSVVLALACGALLSGGMEALQNYLPKRVPSNLDWGLNSLGTLGGALLAAAAHALGWMDRWQLLRDRWFLPRSAGALALLLAWPVALLFPPPLPLGLGQVLARMREGLAVALQDTAFAGWVPPAPETALVPLAPGTELIAVALGLLAPCLLAFSVSPVGWRRLALVFGALVFGVGATTLSTALNFGPQNALAWMTPVSQFGLLAGSLAALLLVLLPPRAVAGLGLVFVTLLVMLVNQAPLDPYATLSLSSWEQGRFIHFHGLAQWIGWLWPFAVLAYLLPHVAAREKPVPQPRPAAQDRAEPLPAEQAPPRIEAMSYYERHIFFCLNERPGDEACCARHGAKAAFEHCKARVKEAGLAGAGKVRVNKAGCLDRCAGAPVAVVYPEATWYTFVDSSDIDEIVDSHLKQGKVVERLLLAPDVGR